MAIPKAKFIGLSSADPDRYGLPRTVGIELNDKHVSQAKELLEYRWFQKKDWQDEIRGAERYHGAMSDPAIEMIRQFLRGRTDVRLAVVFGSRARGTATPDSDVDVAVYAPGVDMLGLAAQLSRVTGHEVDVVPLEEVGVPLLARIVQEGVGVHEARRGALATWRAQALADLETDRPWFARMRDAWLARVASRGV